MSRKVNREVLRRVSERLGALSLIERVDTFPPEKPDWTVAHLPADRYPSAISAVRLQFRLYLDGEFNVVYFEQWDNEIKRCRWDRQENPHNSRDHFHPLPDASRDDADDREFSSDFFEMVGVTLNFVQTRWGETFEETD